MTCKHYGGEVHEIGFLMIFFMPCLYCNVSDAWLIREKSRRLLVTLAGGYCDLCVWALAVLVWRLTPGDATLSTGPGVVHHIAWVTLTVCGTRVFLNFNPLLKLDGYYLLSNWLEVANLRQRSWDYLMGQFRRLAWGAPAPAAEARPLLLLAYGLASWAFSIFYVSLLVLSLIHVFGKRVGLVGSVAAVLFGLYLARGLVSGFTGGEFMKMLLKRYKRTAVWVGLAALAVTTLCAVRTEDCASGPFQVRPVARAEVRAPVSGFLSAVYYDEGDRTTPGAVVACIEVPDLASRTAQKRAEVEEVQAKLRLLEAGPRREELDAERSRLARLREERRYLEGLQQKVNLTCPLGGVVTTARLKEKVGQYLKEGDLVCTLEDPTSLEVEVALEEQSAARVHPGQAVDLKARALPFDKVSAQVTRVASAAVKEKEREHSTVTVYCRLDDPNAALLTGMTGTARIHGGSRSAASLLLDRAYRYLRTEFWW